MDDVTAAGRSIGVEEELLLVDPETGVPIGRSAEVLARAAAEPGGPPDALVQAELVDCIVEAATGRCVSLVDLREQLCHGRRRLGGAARAEGAWLVSTGLPALVERLTPTAIPSKPHGNGTPCDTPSSRRTACHTTCQARRPEHGPTRRPRCRRTRWA